MHSYYDSNIDTQNENLADLQKIAVDFEIAVSPQKIFFRDFLIPKTYVSPQVWPQWMLRALGADLGP